MKQDVELDQQLAGFSMDKYFCDFVLPNQFNFQQYLCRDARFQGYIQLSLGDDTLQYFQKVLMRSKVFEVDCLCQRIMFLLYDMICQSSAKNASTPEIELFFDGTKKEDNEITTLFI